MAVTPHVNCKDLHGVVGQTTQDFDTCSVNEKNNFRRIDSNDIVQRNTQAFLGSESSISDFNKQQLNMLPYTYSYHM